MSSTPIAQSENVNEDSSEHATGEQGALTAYTDLSSFFTGFLGFFNTPRFTTGGWNFAAEFCVSPRRVPKHKDGDRHRWPPEAGRAEFTCFPGKTTPRGTPIEQYFIGDEGEHNVGEQGQPATDPKLRAQHQDAASDRQAVVPVASSLGNELEKLPGTPRTAMQLKELKSGLSVIPEVPVDALEHKKKVQLDVEDHDIEQAWWAMKDEVSELKRRAETAEAVRDQALGLAHAWKGRAIALERNPKPASSEADMQLLVAVESWRKSREVGLAGCIEDEDEDEDEDEPEPLPTTPQMKKPSIVTEVPPLIMRT